MRKVIIAVVLPLVLLGCGITPDPEKESRREVFSLMKEWSQMAEGLGDLAPAYERNAKLAQAYRDGYLESGCERTIDTDLLLGYANAQYATAHVIEKLQRSLIDLGMGEVAARYSRDRRTLRAEAAITVQAVGEYLRRWKHQCMRPA